jgi:hypothetical protein
VKRKALPIVTHKKKKKKEEKEKIDEEREERECAISEKMASAASAASAARLQSVTLLMPSARDFDTGELVHFTASDISAK